MITDRQLRILNRLADQAGTNKKGDEFAHELNVSLKTIQTDIKDLKNLLVGTGAQIEAHTGIGYCLTVSDEAHFNKFRAGMLKSKLNVANFEDQNARILYILKFLLFTREYVKGDDLADIIYLSKSRLTSDLNQIREILAKYDLTLVHKPKYGMKIIGSEMSKRRCITGEGVPVFSFNYFEEGSSQDNELLSDVSGITTEEMLKARYKTSDVVLQNLIMHIFISVKRIIVQECVEDESVLDNLDITNAELQLAENILKELSLKYGFIYPKQEVYYLSLNLLGKKNYESEDVISEKIDTLVINILDKIKNKTGLDLTYDVELRISLALHLVPLMLRIEHNMQLENLLVDEIKQYFTLAYDLAVMAANVIRKEVKVNLRDDEVGYLAIHFNLSLQKQTYSQKPKRILILCSSRRSDSLLMKYKLLRWFKEMISEMEVKNFSELSQTDLSKYDVIFTTTLNDASVPKNAIKINYFLDDSDYRRIERALTGMNEPNEIINFFDKNLFIPKAEAESQEDAIAQMCALIQKFRRIPPDFYESVIRRELLGSTAFGNMIALPHPEGLISDETFVCTAILNHPIIWGNNKIQIILLVSIQQGNEKDLRELFEVLSKVLSDKEGIAQLLKTKSYKQLTEVIKKAFEQI